MPLPLAAIAGVTALGGITNAVGNWIQGRRNVDKTISANKALAEFQYQKDLEMWMRGNEYNSPQAQMERLRQAGLNPNLVYGSGNAPGMSAGQLPKYNAPTVQYDYPAPQVPDLLSQYQDFTMKQAQTNNLQEQNKVIQEQAQLRKWENLFAGQTFEPRTQLAWDKSRAQQLANTLADQKRENITQLFPHQLSYAAGKVRTQSLEQNRINQQISKMDQETQLLQKNNEWYLTKMWSQIINQGLGTVSKFVPKLPGTRVNPGRGKDSTAPWNTTIKTNPRLRNPRRASKGVVNP